MNPPDNATLPPSVRNVILIGYRGCGKTAVGQALAKQLGWRFLDTDTLITTAAGCTIQQIFATWGEARFRQIEREQIGTVLQGSEQVISVGGGAVVLDENRTAMQVGGTCVWLTAPPDTLRRRMLADPQNAIQRPALTQRDHLDEIQHLLALREPLYASVAHRVVNTAGCTIEEVAAAVLAALRSPSK